MSAWFVLRVLPGIVSALLTVGPLFAINHILLRIHITRTANEQTAALAGSGPETTGGAPMTVEAPVITADPVEPRESVFERTADWVSAAMGRPKNIIVWLVLVAGWTLLFALHLVNPAGTFLPAWFTSEGYNFPLNLVTTVAELFIGFLVAAASNRSERNLEATLAGIAQQEAKISAMEDKLSDALDANTALTTEVHKLTEAVHAAVVKGVTT